MIEKSYSMADTKSQYMIKFGIADYLTKKLIYNVNHVPFLFLFDESTNNQVKKQYDGYVSYWSPRYDQVVSAYAGSLFVGHCNADDLTVCCCHVTYAFQSESTLYISLNVKELLARNRRNI